MAFMLAISIELTASAKKELTKLDRQPAKRITTFLRERIASSTTPRNTGKSLAGPLGDCGATAPGTFASTFKMMSCASLSSRSATGARFVATA
jgi:hypothetical protein